MNTRNRILPLFLAAIAAVAAPASATDYVQSSGALSFASEYQGETFVRLFPGFQTTLSFDPAAPQNAQLDVTIPLLVQAPGMPTGTARSKPPTSSTSQGSPPPAIPRVASAASATTATWPMARSNCAE